MARLGDGVFTLRPGANGALRPGDHRARLGRSGAIKERLRPIWQQYSTNREYCPYDLIEEWTRRGLFRQVGERTTSPVAWRPAIAEYLACRRSPQSFSREWMGDANAAAFDDAVKAALGDLERAGEVGVTAGLLELSVEARVIGGTPQYPGAQPSNGVTAAPVVAPT